MPRLGAGRGGEQEADEPTERDAILGSGPAPVAVRGSAGPVRKLGHGRQLSVAAVASLAYLGVGLVRGFSSPGVPSMRQRDPYLLPAAGSASWVSAIPPLGACLGSLAAGPLLQRAGRRRTLLLSAPLAVAAWAALAASASFAFLLAARLLTGFCAGLVIPAAQIYVSECSRPSARGVLGSLPALFMSAGILLGYVVGALVPHWRWLAGVSAGCPALLLVLLLPLPESPSWLLARGRRSEADAALDWLRRPAHTATAAVLNPTARGWRTRGILHPLALSLALMGFQQLSGIDAVVFYTVDIFNSAGGAVPEHAAAAAVGAVQLAANALALLAVDRAGRRPLLLASGAVSAASMAALGAYFHLHAAGRADNLGALPLASLLLFMVGFSIGLCTLPYLMMSEMLPAEQRGALSSFTGAFNLAVMFIVIKTFHDLTGAMGEAGAFWLYAALCAASCVFVLICVPETKGRSLEDIQAHFERRAALPSDLPLAEKARTQDDDKHTSPTSVETADKNNTTPSSALKSNASPQDTDSPDNGTLAEQNSPQTKQ